MKLLLTSNGLKNKEVADAFLRLIDKPINQVHVICVPTASRNEQELQYVNQSRQELIRLGIDSMTTLNLDHSIHPNEIKNADVIYVCGGNTFYLLKKIRESGFDLLLKKFSGVYVGVSAGSIVVGADVEVAAPWDENDNIKMTDTIGLKIVDFTVSPHYEEGDKEILDQIKSRVSYKIIELTDNQAIVVSDSLYSIIGKP